MIQWDLSEKWLVFIVSAATTVAYALWGELGASLLRVRVSWQEAPRPSLHPPHLPVSEQRGRISSSPAFSTYFLTTRGG